MSQRRDKKSGFTIVEVTIAMAFIAVLVITLLMVGMRIASLYNKGITIRDVNSASRNIIRSMQDDIAASSSRMVVFYRKASSGSGGGGGSSSASSGAVKFATNLEEATKEKIHTTTILIQAGDCVQGVIHIYGIIERNLSNIILIVKTQMDLLYQTVLEKVAHNITEAALL